MYLFPCISIFIVRWLEIYYHRERSVIKLYTLLETNSFREKLYQELELEYVYQRRWMKRLRLLYEVSHEYTNSSSAVSIINE